MDLRTVVTFSTLLFVVADQTSNVGKNTSHPSPLTTQTDSTSRNYSGPITRPSTASPTSNTISPPPAPALLTIEKCEGADTLILHHSSSSTSAVCQGSAKSIESLRGIVCGSQAGCKDKRHSDITKEGAVKRTSCETLKVQSTVDEDLQNVQGQLHAYKVVTALLCCVLLVLLLIRFTRPTVKVLQKRLSDRRQNRWIGPTQSHSVSYHRGKTAVRTNDAENRLSYPALERLAVFDSGEPSSNRNSDYNF
ncbi:uncharacterized protein LOC119217835 [Pungitius pungitius]|uniref:uncharacterized protein LOC119217835 n=1 Tax=Pungitius pungitius TaxID=134920 RepID=UPI001888AA2B|nr:uncharacterized protein LOC119217835 [Pungitius pungitius]